MQAVKTISLRVVGVVLALGSCVPMVAMLPAGFVAVLSLIGLTAAPLVAWAAPLAPIAPYLFIVSMLVLAVGHLRCGWQPAAVALFGGLLVYLAMYVLVASAPMNGATPQIAPSSPMEAMSGMATAASGDAMNGMGKATPVPAAPAVMPSMIGRTNAPLFYAGMLLIVSSFGLIWWRRWAKLCQPLNPLRGLRSVVSIRRN